MSEGAAGVVFNLQRSMDALFDNNVPGGVHTSRTGLCFIGKCGAARTWGLELSHLPALLVVVLGPPTNGQSTGFTVPGVTCGQAARPAFPDMEGAAELRIGDAVYDLRVVHCSVGGHHVVYFRAEELHPVRAPAGWYFYDDMLQEGKLWYVGTQFRMWEPQPSTIEHLLYVRRDAAAAH